MTAAAAAKSLQSCPTLCNPIDGSPPASPVPGILQARTLEWAAISFSNAWKWKVKLKSLSCAWLLATSWTAAYQAPLSMGSSRQEYWNGVPSPSPTMTESRLEHRLQNLRLFFFFHFYQDTIDIQHCISLRWTAWSFDLHISWNNFHSIISEHPSSHEDTKQKKKIFPCMRILWIYSTFTYNIQLY